MLSGILAGRAAGEGTVGLFFVAPRMLDMGSGSYSPFDLTTDRFLVCGLVAALVMLPGFGRRPVPSVRQAMAAVGMSVPGFSG